jgi:hypothetical protein
MNTMTSTSTAMLSTITKKCQKKAPAIAVVLFLITSSALYLLFSRGIEVSIHNAGPESVQRVSVHVTGAEYQIGDISHLEKRSCRVFPAGESDVEIRFLAKDGSESQHRIDVYLEPAYRGRIEIEIRDGEIVKTANTVSAFAF